MYYFAPRHFLRPLLRNTGLDAIFFPFYVSCIFALLICVEKPLAVFTLRKIIAHYKIVYQYQELYQAKD